MQQIFYTYLITTIYFEFFYFKKVFFLDDILWSNNTYIYLYH